MKGEWRTEPLGELCDVVGGGTPSKGNPAFYSGEIPWATVRDMRQDVITETECSITKDAVASSATNIIPAGNVIIATRVGLGKVCLLGQDTAINQDLRGIIPRDTKTLSVRFLYWWLKAMADTIIAEGTGATVQGVRLPFVKSLRIPLPPLAEQQRIAGLLDEAFAGIAVAHAHAETNSRNARSLFESHVQAVFSQRGIGWIETTLDKISTNLDSMRVPITKSVRSAGEYPYYGASGIVDYVADYIFEGNNLLVSEDGANLLARSTPIAFSVSGKYWVNNHAHILHFENMATQRFAEFYLESIRLDRYVTGAAQPKLTQRALNSIPIPIPRSVDERARIVEQVGLLQAESRRLAAIYERKQSTLQSLKHSLLHQAFTGNL